MDMLGVFLPPALTNGKHVHLWLDILYERYKLFSFHMQIYLYLTNEDTS